MICKEVVDKTPQTTPISTSIHLSQINKKYLSQFDSDIKTIAKRLTEHLLPYLISSPKHFPKITVID
jgi:phosphoenolpyruvate-protein kinase (PTS system EI component)